METKNAVVTSTLLGYEDHGILTCQIFVNYDEHSSQGFGNRVLDIEYIKNILSVFGVRKWEDLKGQFCRVGIKDDMIIQIGHVLNNNIWFDV